MTDPTAILELSRDAFILRPLPGAARLLVNDGYRGAQIVDCPTAAVVAKIPFPEDVEVFVVGEWHVEPRGAWSLAIDPERPAFGLLLDHALCTARRVAFPQTMGMLSGAAWFDPGPQIATYDGLLWGLHGDALVLEPASESLLAWAARVKAAIPDFDRYSQVRTDLACGQAFVRGPESALVGTVGIPDAAARLVPGQPEILALAGFGGDLWVGFEERVERRSGSRSEVFFECPPEEYLLDVSAVRSGGRGHLAVLTSSQDQRRSVLRLFDIPA